MAGDNPRIEIEGLKQVLSRIQDLPEESKKEVLSEVADYAVTVLAAEPPKAYVTRKAAYGATFQSDRQRKWFFASLNSGKISVPYHRTGNLGAKWKHTTSPDQVVFSNSAPYAPYVVGFASQSRHEKMVGWKNVNDMITGPLSFMSSKFRKVVYDAVNAAIRRLNLG